MHEYFAWNTGTTFPVEEPGILGVSYMESEGQKTHIQSLFDHVYEYSLQSENI